MKKLLILAFLLTGTLVGSVYSQAPLPYGVGIVGAQYPNNPQPSNTSADGFVLQDSVTSSAGNQQYSPRLRFSGQGWGTTAPASYDTEWIIENQPLQGTATPTSLLVFSGQINGSAYGASFSLAGVGLTSTFSTAVNVQRLNVTASILGSNGIYLPAANTLGFYTNGVAGGTVDSTQHWRLGGVAAATIGSGNCGAGSNGTISGNDHAGLITIGASATATCQVSFSASYGTAPRAVILQAANAGAATAITGEYISAIAIGSFTITGTLASTNWYYWVQ